MVNNEVSLSVVYESVEVTLRIQWHPMDSSDTKEYECIYNDEMNLPDQETKDVPGGWSLAVSERGDDTRTAYDVAYALYCNKSIAFDDGTIWKNPEYEKWREEKRQSGPFICRSLPLNRGIHLPVTVLRYVHP